MTTIGLVMIVRDEVNIIERCLASVRPLIDFALIEDTGSMDGTQAAIRQWLGREGVPGEVYEEPWRDFAANRSNVLARLRDEHPALDYALMMDADDQIVLDDGFDITGFKTGLTLDAYRVPIRLHDNHHARVQICRNRRDFAYRGVIHEVLHVPPDAGEVGMVEGFHVEARSEGARSRDPEKYAKDAAVLERALVDEQDPELRSRYVFYLAQSQIGSGEPQKALANYVRRAQMGGWHEEVYVSLYRAARLQEQLGRPPETVLGTLRQATKVVGNRVEAHYDASRIYRLTGRPREGYDIAKSVLGTPPPPEGLFLRIWIYDYGLLDEFAQNALAVGQFDDCLKACESLLGGGKLPPEHRERVQQVRASAVDGIAALAVAQQSGSSSGGL